MSVRAQGGGSSAPLDSAIGRMYRSVGEIPSPLVRIHHPNILYKSVSDLFDFLYLTRSPRFVKE